MKRTKKKKKISRKRNTGPIFVSPDGGETVYEQLPNGDRKLVEMSQRARDNQQAFDELDMVGTEAIALRRKHPALKKAWEQYLTIWHLINENE